MTDKQAVLRVASLFAVAGAFLPFLYLFVFSPIFGPIIGIAFLGMAYLVLSESKTSLTGEAFARRLGRANVALLIFTFAWPILLFGLYKLVSPGRDIPFGFIASIFVKPAVYVAYVIAVLAITKKRLGSLRLEASWLIVLAVAMYSTIVFWLSASAPWSVSFALGSVGGIPSASLAIYSALIALTLVSPAGSEEGLRQRAVLDSPLRTFCSVMLATIVILHVGGQLLSTTSNYDLMRFMMNVEGWIAPLTSAFRIAMLALCYQLWVAAGRPGEDKPVIWVAKAITVVLAASATYSFILSVIITAIYLTQFQVPGIEKAGNLGAYLRMAELLGLMLMPLAIARLLENRRQSSD